MVNPRVAILSCFVYSICIALRSRFYVWDLTPIGLVFFTVCFKNRNRLPRTLLKVAKLNGFVLFVAAGLYAFHRDTELAKTILVRSNLIISFNILVLSSFPAFEIYEGMAALPIPGKMKLLFLYVIKFIEILQREYSKLQEALYIRGFTPKTNFLTYKSYAFIIGNMLAKSLKKSRNMYDAIVVRSFTGRIYTFRERKTELTDFLIAFSILIQTGAALVLGALR